MLHVVLNAAIAKKAMKNDELLADMLSTRIEILLRYYSVFGIENLFYNH